MTHMCLQESQKNRKLGKKQQNLASVSHPVFKNPKHTSKEIKHPESPPKKNGKQTKHQTPQNQTNPPQNQKIMKIILFTRAKPIRIHLFRILFPQPNHRSSFMAALAIRSSCWSPSLSSWPHGGFGEKKTKNPGKA